MIILGYPGICKSYLTNHLNVYANIRGICHYPIRTFDLDSSNFVIDGKKIENWEIPYCKISYKLSEYGDVVFLSCHDEVQRAIASLKVIASLEVNRCKSRKCDCDNDDECCMTNDIYIVGPSKESKDALHQILIDRYKSTNDDKDKRALNRFENHFDDDIDGLINNKYGLTYIPLNITKNNPYPFTEALFDLIRDMVVKDFSKKGYGYFGDLSKDEIKVYIHEPLDLNIIFDDSNSEFI